MDPTGRSPGKSWALSILLGKFRMLPSAIVTGLEPNSRARTIPCVGEVVLKAAGPQSLTCSVLGESNSVWSFSGWEMIETPSLEGYKSYGGVVLWGMV